MLATFSIEAILKKLLSRHTVMFCRTVSFQEPFVEAQDIFKTAIEEALQKKLVNYFRHVETEILLALLTEYIISELPQRTENDIEFP